MIVNLRAPADVMVWVAHAMPGQSAARPAAVMAVRVVTAVLQMASIEVGRSRS